MIKSGKYKVWKVYWTQTNGPFLNLKRLWELVACPLHFQGNYLEISSYTPAGIYSAQN